MIHTNRGNKCKIISIDAEKALDKMNTNRYLEKKNLASSRDGKGFALLEINIYIFEPYRTANTEAMEASLTGGRSQMTMYSIPQDSQLY